MSGTPLSINLLGAAVTTITDPRVKSERDQKVLSDALWTREIEFGCEEKLRPDELVNQITFQIDSSLYDATFIDPFKSEFVFEWRAMVKDQQGVLHRLLPVTSVLTKGMDSKSLIGDVVAPSPLPARLMFSDVLVNMNEQQAPHFMQYAAHGAYMEYIDKCGIDGLNLDHEKLKTNKAWYRNPRVQNAIDNHGAAMDTPGHFNDTVCKYWPLFCMMCIYCFLLFFINFLVRH